ncbi:tetratricopeptide repeat protein [Streptomyces sp. ISL-86]|uniref:tetratricopeptide repeat protein n=1 Tax=Streptomyces sp. ISL-86 TaxID=2819187 RepID=UPI001BE8DE02|nr:tetratricopeptide repeat protein [Streptomyces sp. ISL-86]MBT2455755.1 tetratricopeptide repeat protein [Streptomyces sp. ISL-86]
MSRALQQADALFDLGRYEQAAALAAQHLAGDPDDATALVLLARCRHRLGDEQQALTTVEAHNNLSLLHLRRRWLRPGSWTRAAEGFVQSAALDLNDRQARYNLETMAWGTVAGSRWVALAGIVAVSSGSAHLRAGAAGTDALVTYLVCAAVPRRRSPGADGFRAAALVADDPQTPAVQNTHASQNGSASSTR